MRFNVSNLKIIHFYFRLEHYFSSKQSSPEGNSHTVNLSLTEENNTISQLQSNKQINLNTSKETEANESSQNNVTGKKTVNFIL